MIKNEKVILELSMKIEKVKEVSQEWEDSISISTDDTSQIGSLCKSRIRGGGVGSDAWVAKVDVEIQGKKLVVTDREWIKKDYNSSSISKSQRSGTIVFEEIAEVGLYEFGNFTNSCSYTSRGFFFFDGIQICKLTKLQIKKIIKSN